MQEFNFIKQLQLRAKEQEYLLDSMPFPKIFLHMSKWFSDHPLRYIIPMSILLTLLFRSFFGITYTNFILWLFSKI